MPENAAYIDMKYSSFIDASLFGGSILEPYIVNLKFNDQTPGIHSFSPNSGVYLDQTAFGSIQIGQEVATFNGAMVSVNNDFDSVAGTVDVFTITMGQEIFIPSGNMNGSFFGSNAVSASFDFRSTDNKLDVMSDDSLVAFELRYSSSTYNSNHVNFGSTRYRTASPQTSSFHFSSSYPVATVSLPPGVPLLWGGFSVLGFAGTRFGRKRQA